MESYARRPVATALGIGLVLVGVVVLGARVAGIDLPFDPSTWWPLFIVVPGVLLFAAAFVATAPNGVGLAIAGAIVATVGSILFVEQATDRYDAWAYAWTLLPGAAGLAMVVYGLFTRATDLIRRGLVLAGLAAILFVTFAWFFEPILLNGRPPLDVGAIWPVAVIVVGAVIVFAAFRRGAGTPTA